MHVVGPVGDDFGAAELEVLATRGTDVADVERVAGGQTFFWKGEYGWDLNSRETLATDLNVFADFEPKLAEASRDCDVLFLANIQPELQLSVLEQCHSPRFVALDSMNLWIDIARDALVKVIERVDCLVLNDAELRQLTGKPSLVGAAREVMTMGPSVVVAKQGEYGAALFSGESFFSLPAYPLESVIDPTGAGDTFAGGFVGHIARNLDSGHERARAAPGRRLRNGAGLLQRRGVRHRARGPADRRRDSGARRRAAGHDAVRGRRGPRRAPVTARIIDGRAIAGRLREQVAVDVSAFTAAHGRPPGLATVLIGDDPASAIYVAGKHRACAEVGIASLHRELAADVDQTQALAVIDELNADPAVSGILCQLPVPDHLDGDELTGRIDPDKDVDGLTVVNAGRLALGLPGLRPCTPFGVMVLLEETGVELTGARAVVIGRSNLFGKPMGQLLLAANATVTMCHLRTRDLPRCAATPMCSSPPWVRPRWCAESGSSPAPRSSTSA